MRRLFTICLLALSATALLVAPPAASAAKRKKVAKPKITRVTPMRISVGARLTIRGKNFNRKRSRNTVIFRGPSGRSAFVKPRRASRRKLVVVIPAKVSRLLRGELSDPRPTRLKLRVLSRRKFSRFTRRRLSPVVTGFGEGDGPGGGGGSGAGGGAGAVVNPCADDADHDDDLLANDLEDGIGTDRCLADSDGDQMTDGWEYYSAKDLNVKAVPYPGKRPFPNALDPTDGGAGATFSSIDFDGDGLTTLEEYRAWRFTGSSFDGSRAGGVDLESPLSYSDGTKFSRASEVPGVPAWRGPAYGLPAPAQPFPATYDMNGDSGLWRDDERDADGDGLANWLESARGPGKPSWWGSYWDTFDPAASPWRQGQATECGQEFGEFTERPFAELDMADHDVDGDTLLDGEDDQDNDDVNNITELYETVYDLDGDGGFTCTVINDEGEVESSETYPSVDVDPGPGVNPQGINAFNPCAPNPSSRTCHDYRPF
ncbi:MAG: IPT/TIG domain-containing protein [Thermoleophilaceae bacterium]